jgi:hypothetical protein
MDKLFKILENNKIDYQKLKEESIIDLLDDGEYYINIIVGFRGRTEFVEPLVESFKEAIKYYSNIDNDKKICLTFVEHDDKPNHIELLKNNVNYIWSRGNVSEFYNRSFTYNFGVKYSNKAKYYILHDLDILVKPNYIEEIVNNLNNDTVDCMQSYGNRHVWYLTKDLTNRFLNKEISITELDVKRHDINPPNLTGSKGGSILISRDLFNKVGGFDPELFWGYAAEDQMFWSKIESISQIHYADNPTVNIFHMWHPPTHTTNPNTPTMDGYFLYYNNMNLHDKLKFLDSKIKLYETNS